MRTDRRARKLISILLVLMMLFSQADFTMIAYSVAEAQEADGGETQAPVPTPEAEKKSGGEPEGEPSGTEEKSTPKPTATETTEAPASEPAASDKPTAEPTPSAEGTAAPEETAGPEETGVPEETAAPGETAGPEETGEPETAAPEDQEAIDGLLSMGFVAKSEGGFTDPLEAAKFAAESDGYVFVAFAQIEEGQHMPVKTGEPFIYDIYYTLYPGPVYQPSEATPTSAYESYENAFIRIKAPENIKLYKDGNLIALPGEYAVIPLSGETDSANIQIVGIMIDNGMAADNTDYGKIEVSINASVTLPNAQTGEDETVLFGHTLEDSKNQTIATNNASTEWDVRKTADGNAAETSGDGETVTFTYYIEAGRKVGNAISGVEADYNVNGTLNFADFRITDTLPSFTNAAGDSVASVSSKITLVGGGAEDYVVGAQGATELTIDKYNAIALETKFLNNNVGTAGARTPFYSKYKVEVTYNVSDLTLPYGDSRIGDGDTFSLTNNAALYYKPVGESGFRSPAPTSSAEIVWQNAILPATINVEKYIVFDDASLPYGGTLPFDGEWTTAFPGPAEFELYLADDWDTGTNEPKGGVAPLRTISLDSNSDTDHIVTPLEPGTYYIRETRAPQNTQLSPQPQQIVLESGESETVSFRNEPNVGILTLRKMGINPQTGNRVNLAGAVFALSNGTNTYTGTSNIDGTVYIVAPAGTYTLTETKAPTSPVKYIPIDPMTGVTITTNETTDLGIIDNEVSLGNLIVNKYAMGYTDTGDVYDVESDYVEPIASVTDSSKFSFRLSWEDENGEEQSEVLRLNAGSSSITRVGLPRLDANGSPILYTLVELPIDPADASFTIDPKVVTFSLGNKNGTKVADFFNQMKGSLKISKRQEDLSGTSNPSGVGFTLYKKTGENTYEVAAKADTGEGGIAAFSGLAICNDAGNLIEYYLAEDAPGNYEVDFTGDDSETPVTIEGVQAWPITLGFSKVTDLTGEPVVNSLKKGRLTIVKKSAADDAFLEGAVFNVYSLDEDGSTKIYVTNGGEKDFTTDENGQIVIDGLDLDVEYFAIEITAPEGFLLSGWINAGEAPVEDQAKAFTLDTPLDKETLTFTNNRMPVIEITKYLHDLTATENEDTAKEGVRFEVYTLTDSVKKTFTKVDGVDAQVTGAEGKAVFALPAAGTYYLKEIFPEEAITPEMEAGLYSSSFTVGDDGGFYYGPIVVELNDIKQETIINHKNEGELTVAKKDVKSGRNITSNPATFKVSVTPADAATIGRLAALGFTEDAGGVYTYTLVTGDDGNATLEGLPIYEMESGTAISYSIEETVAPEGYFLSNGVETASFTTAETRAFEAEFANTPHATIRVRKLGTDAFESKGHQRTWTLPGAAMDAYKVTVVGGVYTLTYAGSDVTDENGYAEIGGLDGLGTYVVFERTAPEGYDLDITGAKEPLTEGSLGGRSYSESEFLALFVAHNGALLSDGKPDAHAFAGTANEYTFNRLMNYRPYAQFRLIKLDAKDKREEDKDTLLNHAQYELYSSPLDEAYKDWSFADLLAANRLTKEDYTYETGTEFGADGSFVTNPQKYGLVYWLVETAAPYGYENPVDHVVGPIVPSESGWAGTPYGKNGLTGVEDTNEPLNGGGEDPRRFLQVEINKIVVDGENSWNMPGATFKLYLSNANSEKIRFLSTMTTGLDMGDAPNPEAVAGRAISLSFDMSVLYSDPDYKPYIEVDDEDNPTSYRATFLLQEVEYPSNVTPERLTYVFTAGTAPESGVNEVDGIYTLNKYYTGIRSIRNRLAQKVPLTVRKLGKDAVTEATYPLGGVRIGVFEATGKTELMHAFTDDFGYASFVLEPETTYVIKETYTVEGHEKDSTEHRITTGLYGAEPIEVAFTNDTYRNLTIIKKDAVGNPVSGIVFNITYTGGDSIKDPNEAPLSGLTVATDADGKATIPLPACPAGKTYQINEVSGNIGGRELTATEKNYFLIANGVADGKGQSAKVFTISKTYGSTAEYKFEAFNPGKGSLALTKTDDTGAPMANVAFIVEFAPFKALNEASANAPYASAKSGDWVVASGGSGWETNAGGKIVWRTDENGQINKENLLPGWYRLTEILPDHYTAPAGGLTKTVKVSGVGLGGNTPATLNIVNPRKAWVSLTKTFRQAYTGPVAFTFHKKADGAVAGILNLNFSGETSLTDVIELDQGSYYVTESAGDWYSRYALGTDDPSTTRWLKDSYLAGSVSIANAFEITLTGDNTAVDTAARAYVYNDPRFAAVKIQKHDDVGGPVEGAVFEVYYKDAENNPVALPSSAATDENGLATLTVQLPWTRVRDNVIDYFLREVSAPARYELAADLALSALTPGAVIDLTGSPIIDKTGLIVDLTKYARRKSYIANPEDSLLSGAVFELYRVNVATKNIEARVATGSTVNGELRFGNLPRLTGDLKYYLREVGADGFVDDALELYDGETPIQPETIGGYTLFPVAKDGDATLQGYNTPLRSIAVLKYNYNDPLNPNDMPNNAWFNIYAGEEVNEANRVGRLAVGQYLAGSPESLDGGSVVKDSAKGYYRDAGRYYSSVILGGLTPGTYTVVETDAPTTFLKPSGTTAGEPWHTTGTVTVGDNGETEVLYFANVRAGSVKPAVKKSVHSVNGVAADASTKVPSLQDGTQTVVFKIADIASTAANPIKLPVDKIEVLDDKLAFTGNGGSPVVAHYVNHLTIGAAGYMDAQVAPIPTGDAAKVQAEVYGVVDGLVDAVPFATVNITGVDKDVFFPAETYNGFKVVYKAEGSGAVLQPGITLGPIYAEMTFVQGSDPDLVLARAIKNTVDLNLSYSLGTSQYSHSSSANASVDVEINNALPKATLTKTATKPRETGYEQSTGDSLQPGDTVRYILMLTNTSSLPIPDPVLVDRLPEMVNVDLSSEASFRFETLPSGLKAASTGIHTDAGINYLYSGMTGALNPGESVVMRIEGTVRFNAVLASIASIENTAFATSAHRLRLNKENPYGTPFTDNSGVLPATGLDGSMLGGTAGETYMAISASTSVGFTQGNKLSISKLVAADVSGLGNFVSSNEYAIASVRDPDGDGEGEILYKIVISNGDGSVKKNVRMVDRLPTFNDVGMNGSSRLSRWPITFGNIVSVVDGSGNGVGYTLYSTTESLSKAQLESAEQFGPTGCSTGAGADAKAFLLDFGSYNLASGGKIIITYRAWAPDASVGASTLEDYYFEASVNDAGAAANTYNTVVSRPAKVVLMPESVSAGNRVWIDQNGNGIQDGENIDDPDGVTGEPSYMGDMKVTLLKYYNSDTVASVAGHADLADGFYRFDGLTPAVIAGDEREAYNEDGVINSKLKGSIRVSYQIKVENIPDGYVVTMPYATSRQADSNFKKSGSAYVSEKFILTSGREDLTFDLGLCRIRDLEIQKKGSNALPLENVGFSIYGPFTQEELDGGVEVGVDNLVVSGINTLENGKATFASSADAYLNYYSNYVVVETTPASSYDASSLTASGGSPSVVAGGYEVTGTPIDGKNYFVLPAKSDSGETPDSRKDSVTVTNQYVAKGSTTISGVKTLNGRDIIKGEFTFRLDDVTDPENPVMVTTEQNGDADDADSISFTLDYVMDGTRSDVGTHVYELYEVPGSYPDTHTYSGKRYTITVTVEPGVGEDGKPNGTLSVQKTVSPDGAIEFVNDFRDEATLTLTGTKTLIGVSGDGSLGSRTLAAGEFAFGLYPLLGEAPNWAVGERIDLSFSDADGTITFDGFPAYDQVDFGKTFHYLVAEEPTLGAYGRLPGHTYEAKRYLVSVVVGYADGKLTVTPSVDVYGEAHTESNEPLAFVNTYDAEASVTFSGSKNLTGRELNDGKFTFTLKDVTDPENPVTLEQAANADGGYAFGSLTYGEEHIGQTFRYTITEDIPEEAELVGGGYFYEGYYYDATVHTIVVTVGYETDGSLTLKVADDNGEALETEAFDFENSYKAVGSFTPEGTKTLTGRDLMDGMFRFEVRDEENALVSTGVSNADGTITFEPILYEVSDGRDDTGEHTYTVTEIAGNTVGIEDDGTIYSAQSYALTVTVTDDGIGILDVLGVYSDAIRFENSIQRVNVRGEKIWVDEANRYGKRPEGITVYLVADGVRIDEQEISGDGDTWRYSFTELPKYRYDGDGNATEINYSVDESEVAGYAKSITKVERREKVAAPVDNEWEAIEYRITNTLRTLTISKRTVGGARLAGATLALYRVRGGARTLIESWQTSSTSDRLVTGLEAGNYALVETVVPDGYVKAQDIAITIAADGTVTSSALSGGTIRMIDEPIPLGTVTGTKTWVDLGNAGGTRPESIALTLYADGTPVKAQPTWTKNGDIWTYTYTGLRIYRNGNSGARVVYTVEEAPVANYEATYDGLNIVNQLPEIEIRYIEVSGAKTWVDDNDAAGARPESITVYLLRNGAVIQTKVVTEADGWSYSFSNLPTSDGRNAAYTYTINEKMVPGYARSVRGNNIINTYVPTETPPTPPKTTPRTPENWEELITLLDPDVPLFGGLLKTGEEIPLYPFVFGGLGLMALLAVLLADRRKRRQNSK